MGHCCNKIWSPTMGPVDPHSEVEDRRVLGRLERIGTKDNHVDVQVIRPTTLRTLDEFWKLPDGAVSHMTEIQKDKDALLERIRKPPKVRYLRDPKKKKPRRECKDDTDDSVDDDGEDEDYAP